MIRIGRDPSVEECREVVAARLSRMTQVNGCWIAAGPTRRNRTWAIRLAGRVVLAHRVFYTAAKGPIPEGLVLDHLCRVPQCVNPDHLEPVTPAENSRRGLGTKLSPDDVSEIRGLRLDGLTYREIARRYGMSAQGIYYICSGRNWRAA